MYTYLNTFPDSTPILPHSESIEEDGIETEEGSEEQIEQIGQAEANEDPEVLAGMIELSLLCECHKNK
jgi:hypothetical protein